jgi:hypothetical protein
MRMCVYMHDIRMERADEASAVTVVIYVWDAVGPNFSNTIFELVMNNHQGFVHIQNTKEHFWYIIIFYWNIR